MAQAALPNSVPALHSARNISPAEAGEYIAGYTIANDYGLHDFRDTDAGSMLRVKGSDTLCPLGPVAASALMGDRATPVPALRRLDSLLLVGPLWAFAAAALLR